MKCFTSKVCFKKNGIEVEEIMLDDNPDALEFVKSLGHTTAPVVVVEANGVVLDHWSDFREDRIKSLKTRVA